MMTSVLRFLGVFPVPLAICSVALVGFGSVDGHAAVSSCAGTLLQLKVRESARTSVDRFRFSLQVQAESTSSAKALQILNQQLDQVRRQLGPLTIGRLTIPAPRIYSFGVASNKPRQQAASTSVSGEVQPVNYDALIQTAGRIKGVKLQGMSSIAGINSAAKIQEILLKKALGKGLRQAKITSDALGLRDVRLLRIDQREEFSSRPVAYASAQRRFSPDEAPKPESTVDLSLEYCLK